MNGNLVEVFKRALAEFKDLDAKEAQQVTQHMKQRIDLDNKALEAKIEAGIDLLERTYAILPILIDLGTDWVEWIGDWKTAA